MDKILIQGLKVNAILGIYDQERVTPQPIKVDITLYTIERDKDRPDVFEGCLDYEQISLQVRAHIIAAKKLTVEALAEELAELCLSVDQAREVTIRVIKTRAIEFTDGVGVEIHRVK